MNQSWDKSHFRLVCERGVMDFQLQLATFVESREPDTQTFAPSFWIPGCGLRRICEPWMTQEQQLATTLEIRKKNLGPARGRGRVGPPAPLTGVPGQWVVVSGGQGATQGNTGAGGKPTLNFEADVKRSIFRVWTILLVKRWHWATPGQYSNSGKWK